MNARNETNTGNSSSRRVFVFRRRPSESARQIARVLGARTTRVTNSKFNPARATAVVNWGSTLCPTSPNVINGGQAVAEAVDKGLLRDKLLAAGDIRIPETLTQEQAIARLRDGRKVVVRSLMRASEGRGMRVIDNPEELPTHIDGARVRDFTKYIPKRHEYRVHCADGVGVFFVQQKRKRREHDGHNYQIRNRSNGWVFAHNEIHPPPCDVLRQAWRGFSETDLDFGAVDIIWNERSGKAWLLEINTAPGLEGETLLRYGEVLRELIRRKS